MTDTQTAVPETIAATLPDLLDGPGGPAADLPRLTDGSDLVVLDHRAE
ncbi:hypothetical protein [Streptomyces eurythermus]